MRTKKQFFNLKAAYRSDFKSFLRSIVALLLVVMLVFCSTYAWIEGAKNAEAKGEECTVVAGSGVQFIGPDLSSPTSVNLPNKTTLSDCSSVDGRNIFIPTTGSIRQSTQTATNTANIKFRKAIEEDKNNKFLTAEFSIKSLEAPSDDSTKKTPIYIDSSSTFTCTSGSPLPFRVSLNFNDGSDPVLLCPGLANASQTNPVSAVSSITDAGVATTKANTTAYPMQKYFYGLTPVYQLPYGETRKVTVTLWLEGTDSKCTTSDVSAKSINMSLVLTTEDTDMRTIKFVDYSPKTWVGSDNATMYVIDENNTNAIYTMNKSGDKTYTAKIPKGINNIVFQRSVNSSPTITNDHNTWSDNVNDNLTTSGSSTYYAIGRGAEFDVDNYGYWVKDTCTGVVTIKYVDTGHAISSSASNYPFIHLYDSSEYGQGNDKLICGRQWPGFQMDLIEEKTTGNIYSITVPANNGMQYIINDNKTENSKRKSGTLTGLNQNANSTITVTY